MTVKPSFVYILECSDGSLYTGWTTNIEKRVACHNVGKGAKYTRSRRPVLLVWSRHVETKGAALRLEARIKKLSRAQKLRLVAGVDVKIP